MPGDDWTSRSTAAVVILAVTLAGLGFAGWSILAERPHMAEPATAPR
ncbi:MAG: hypothetical protein ACFBSD_06165 [Paracoccaceae bacterium]